MADAARIQAINSELTLDPQGVGYTGDDAGDLALMLAVNRSVDRPTMSGSEIFEAIDNAEWAARSADQKDDIKFVLALGDSIQIAAGTKARAMLQAALAGATTSLNNLGTIAVKTVSRAEEKGFGSVHLGDIQNARAV